MLKNLIKKISVFFTLFPFVTYAQAPGGIINTKEDVESILIRVGDWMYGVLLLVSVIFIVYSGYLFLFSGGDTEKTEKAKKQILYAVIAVIVAILAKGIIALTENFLGVPATPAS